jgi:hypothetical protein
MLNWNESGDSGTLLGDEKCRKGLSITVNKADFKLSS